MDIRGFLNVRQIVYAIATGLVVGVGASIEHLSTHPELIKGAIGPMLGGLAMTALSATWFAWRGRPVDEVAKEITDKILGDDTLDY